MIYFLTFSTYGTHLPGDSRGSIHQQLHQGPQRKLMTEPAYRLERAADRAAVLETIIEVCRHREWRLIAPHVRAEHVHGVVHVECVSPSRVPGDGKSYSSRALRKLSPGRKNFWTVGGDARRCQGRD